MNYKEITEKIRERARELLATKKVGVIIGWAQGSTPQKTHPVFITNPDDVEQLVWNKFCYNNLSEYLNRQEIRAYGRMGIISKGCDNKAIVGLLQEFQIEEKDIYIIGVVCEGMGEPEPLDKCRFCDVHTPVLYDELIGEQVDIQPEEGHFADVEKIEQMSREERWEFWQKEFEKCIRCYACRQVCPLCHCRRCIVDKNQPQWIDLSSHPRGNFAWNFIRAFHLAGRCIECGECERACPMNIPLMLINKKLIKDVQELYEYRAGYDPKAVPPISTWREADDESFII
ncbi:4Fe-4S dicluster domain-containing protein [Candidatus Sumerlaeota bacterium]|nr:4Fe-4S dicluster domain-containing protein [Candidatus Sumerlaeota bacterium]